MRPDDLFSGFSDDWQTFVARIRDTRPSDQLKGRYVAVLDGAPFIETGLPNVHGAVSSTVIGVLKSGPDEPGQADTRGEQAP